MVNKENKSIKVNKKELITMLPKEVIDLLPNKNGDDVFTHLSIEELKQLGLLFNIDILCQIYQKDNDLYLRVVPDYFITLK